MERPGGREEPEIAIQVAIAPVNKGVTLGQLDRPEEVVAAYEELVEQLRESQEADVARIVDEVHRTA